MTSSGLPAINVQQLARRIPDLPPFPFRRLSQAWRWRRAARLRRPSCPSTWTPVCGSCRGQPQHLAEQACFGLDLTERAARLATHGRLPTEICVAGPACG